MYICGIVWAWIGLAPTSVRDWVMIAVFIIGVTALAQGVKWFFHSEHSGWLPASATKELSPKAQNVIVIFTGLVTLVLLLVTIFSSSSVRSP